MPKEVSEFTTARKRTLLNLSALGAFFNQHFEELFVSMQDPAEVCKQVGQSAVGRMRVWV